MTALQLTVALTYTYTFHQFPLSRNSQAKGKHDYPFPKVIMYFPD